MLVPFETDALCRLHDPALSQLNSAYWQAFERKVRQTNEAGFVLALVGLMETPRRYPDATALHLITQHPGTPSGQRTGRYDAAQSKVETAGVTRLAPPARGEWILTLKGLRPPR